MAAGHEEESEKVMRRCDGALFVVGGVGRGMCLRQGSRGCGGGVFAVHQVGWGGGKTCLR